MNITLEIACFTLNAAISAAELGANRIELCDNPLEGGTTPSLGFLEEARKQISIPIFPIIRPRGGDFLYEDHEFRTILKDISICKSIGFEGVVTGTLNKDGTIDHSRMEQIIKSAYPMEVTFHRAFDRLSNPIDSLQLLIKLGCTRVLTSGGYPTVAEGLENIQHLIEVADNDIIILPGSGIRSNNLKDFIKKLPTTEFHSSARKPKPSTMQYINPRMQENLAYFDVDQVEIQAMLDIIHQLSSVNQNE